MKIAGSTLGQLAATLYGCETGYEQEGEGNGIISEGVVANADGSYSLNTFETTSKLAQQILRKR